MNSIELYTNHRNILAKDLQHFVAMYNGDQTDLISALADKINHMCNNIGSPSSVIPMLKGIVKGKLKVWSLGDWNTLPRKIKSRIHIAEVDRRYFDGIVKGHFRWNFGTGYIANYHTRNYIQAYFIDNEVDNFLAKNGRDTGFRFQIVSGVAQKWSEDTYTVEVTTISGNDFRFHYYVDGDRVTSNYGLDDVTPTEREYTKRMINKAYKTNF